MKRSLAYWAVVPLVALVVVLLDQWSKGWIETNIPLGASITPIPALKPYFNLVHYANTGAAFGILRGGGSFFIVVTFVVIAAVLVYARQLPDNNWGVRLCLGLLLGGAVGNLIDRLQRGPVTDFLRFTLPVGGRIYEWPAWNVADASLVVGTILLGILMLWSERRGVAGAPADQQ